MEVGGWVHISSKTIELENRPKTKFYIDILRATMLVCNFFCMYIIKCVSHYDLSVLSTSVMSFQQTISIGSRFVCDSSGR